MATSARCSNPKCGSNNYRMQETGALHNIYYCNACKQSFSRRSPYMQQTALGVIVAVGIGILKVLFGSDDSSNGPDV